jgi:hypothetical protein
MEPSGIYWQGFYDRLRRGGDDICLMSCQAVRHNRKTMQEATGKTDALWPWRPQKFQQLYELA